MTSKTENPSERHCGKSGFSRGRAVRRQHLLDEEDKEPGNARLLGKYQDPL